MTKRLLDGHPEVFVYPRNELHFFRHTEFPKILTRWPAEKMEMDARLEEVLGDKKFNYLPEDEVDPTNIPPWYGFVDIEALHIGLRQARPANYAELFEAIMVETAKASKVYSPETQTRFAAKGVQQEEYFLELRSWFPNLKFIYVLRNPYGQINSAINNMRMRPLPKSSRMRLANNASLLGEAGAFPFLGKRLKEMKLSYYLAEKFSRLFPENFYVMRYDELITNPQTSLEQLCAFLEIDMHPCLFELSVCGQVIEQSGWTLDGDKHISSKPREGWKNQLPDGVKDLIAMHFRDVLNRYGFQVHRPGASRFRRLDKSEKATTYIANRFLYTRFARQMF